MPKGRRVLKPMKVRGSSDPQNSKLGSEGAFRYGFVEFFIVVDEFHEGFRMWKV